MAEDTPTQAADKAQAPATFSSFINKSGSGKKFAPKAARRRPGAAPAVVSKAPAAPASAATEPQSTQPAPEPSTAAENAVIAPLPTPAPTQEPVNRDAVPQDPPATGESHSTTAPTDPAIPATVTTPAPTPVIDHSQPSHDAALPPATHHDAPPPVEDDIEGARSPKRRRIESTSRQSTPMMPVAVMVPSQDGQTLDTTSQQPDEAVAAPTAESGEPNATTAADGETPTQKRTRRNLPWTAVNHPLEEGGEATEVVEPPAEKKRAPAKSRAKRKAATADGEQQDDVEEEVEPTQTRTSTRARGKRNVDVAETAEVGEDGQPVEPAPKKPRQSKKTKGKQPAADGEAEEGEATTKPKTQPKPRAPRRKKSATAEGEDGSVGPKRRGRPPREDTPSDAEDHIIDPDAMCMDDLASRNIRVGKLSRREKEMRKIDWDAVKQRRREEDARHISTKESQAAVDKLLEMGEVEAAPTGPRYHVVDGRIELIHESGTIDRERDADREIELMTITEEDDLTTRITARSFMKNNKRFPNEFVLPGQGKRWNAESTDMFYQGLRSFGTDFQMIAHMFPGMTRRSIKTKFTREERENPDIVRECLRGKSELASHWDHFLAASQLEEESFADADAIKRELEEEEARMREQINEALREKEEREKQKRLAGVAEEGEGEKENGKGKKKRKQKDKNVSFQEEGVEILGDVDEDPNWGVE